MKYKEGLVSIIVPIYNAEKTIIDLLDSIEMQTYKNYEVLLINDGSSDNTHAIINEYCKDKDKYNIINQSNQGAPKARNKGIELSNGAYIYLCDADDVLFDRTLELLINTAKAKCANIVIGEKVDFRNNNLDFVKYDILPKRFLKLGKLMYLTCDPLPGNKLYEKKLIDMYRITFANVKIGQDLNFFIKCVLVSNCIALVNEPVYKYRIMDTGISRTYKYNTIIDIKKSFENINEFINFNKSNINQHKIYLLNYIKLNNYLWQLRKKSKLNSSDYSLLKKELLIDLNVINKKNIKYSLAFYIELIEYFFLKYFNILLR